MAGNTARRELIECQHGTFRVVPFGLPNKFLVCQIKGVGLSNVIGIATAHEPFDLTKQSHSFLREGSIRCKIRLRTDRKLGNC
jgi:hypothetical protein